MPDASYLTRTKWERKPQNGCWCKRPHGNHDTSNSRPYFHQILDKQLRNHFFHSKTISNLRLRFHEIFFLVTSKNLTFLASKVVTSSALGDKLFIHLFIVKRFTFWLKIYLRVSQFMNSHKDERKLKCLNKKAEWKLSSWLSMPRLQLLCRRETAEHFNWCIYNQRQYQHCALNLRRGTKQKI